MAENFYKNEQSFTVTGLDPLHNSPNVIYTNKRVDSTANYSVSGILDESRSGLNGEVTNEDFL